MRLVQSILQCRGLKHAPSVPKSGECHLWSSQGKLRTQNISHCCSNLVINHGRKSVSGPNALLSMDRRTFTVSSSSWSEKRKVQGSASDSISDSDDHPVLEVLTRPVTVKTVSVMPGRGPPPEVPTVCCQSGCANCVWIMYAEEMKKYYSDGGKKAREAIMQIEDPNLRCFLLLEIK